MACKSIVNTLSTLTALSTSHTTLADIGVPESDFLSCREYGKNGIITVTEAAPARLAASTSSSN